jgi:cytochrome c553
MSTTTRVFGLLALLAGLALPATGATQSRYDDTPALKAITCTACHGAAGNSRSDMIPILAGMDARYFKKQIQDYASGLRVSPEMEPYAKLTLTQGADEIAAFFARQKAERTSIRSDGGAVARGREAAKACAVCHGAEGRGDKAKLIPSLAGQPPGYLRAQLLLLKADQRSPKDDTLKAVKALLKTIPDERLADLAAYYSSLNP